MSSTVTERITPTQLARRTGAWLHRVALGATVEVVDGRYPDVTLAVISPPQPDREAASDR